MEISWLRTFVTAAKYGNFRRAAEVLHLAQPTVTVQIQKLEAGWQVSLFERIGRNVQLTPAGKRFLRHAEDLLMRYEESIQDMARWREGFEDVIIISVAPIIATTFLPRWIRAFTSIYKSVTFTVRVVPSNQIGEDVSGLEADIGFSRTAQFGSKICCEPIYDDPLSLVAPIDADSVGDSPRLVEEVFRKHTLFTHNHPGFWDNLLFELRSHFGAIRTMQVTQAHVCLDWILEGMGVSFLPISTVRRAVSIGAVELIPFNLFNLPVTKTYMVNRQNQTDIVSAFSSFVRDYMSVRPLV